MGRDFREGRQAIRRAVSRHASEMQCGQRFQFSFSSKRQISEIGDWDPAFGQGASAKFQSGHLRTREQIRNTSTERIA